MRIGYLARGLPSYLPGILVPAIRSDFFKEPGCRHTPNGAA